ncbi:MAG TPA: ferredoxin [Solirubrobacteraceae bacterium]|jgi:ferredoxin|nr:ferredoxin [Solirubrobacteraceae bacterium]
MSYVPRIDESSCIAQGDCMDLLPEVFQVEDCARVVGTGPNDLILTAARECPVEAITIIDSETGAQVYP